MPQHEAERLLWSNFGIAQKAEINGGKDGSISCPFADAGFSADLFTRNRNFWLLPGDFDDATESHPRWRFGPSRGGALSDQFNDRAHIFRHILAGGFRHNLAENRIGERIIIKSRPRAL